MCDNIETANVLNNLPNVKEEVGKKSEVDNESVEEAQLPIFSSGIEDTVFISLSEIKQENDDEEAVGISEETDNLCEEQTKVKEEIKVEDSITDIALTESDGNLDFSCPFGENTLPKAFSPVAHCNLVKEEAEYQGMKIEDTSYERKDADEKIVTNIAVSRRKCNLLLVPEETNSKIGVCLDSQNVPFNDTFLEDGFKNDLRDTSGTLKRPYTCDVCKETFPLMSKLKSHFRIHARVKPFKCGECGTAFVRKFSLKIHMRTHMGIKPYKCDICGKCFPQNHHLIRHRMTHKGVGPYKCQMCSDAFYKSEELKVHKNMHKQMLLTCFKCNKIFSSARDLKHHEITHTGDRPYKCQLCSKSFLKLSYLTVHVQSHTSDRPFKCTECDKSFKYKSSLVQHIRVHQGIRPFKCTHCEKSFTVLRLLNKHMKIHNGV